MIIYVFCFSICGQSFSCGGYHWNGNPCLIHMPRQSPFRPVSSLRSTLIMNASFPTLSATNHSTKHWRFHSTWLGNCHWLGSSASIGLRPDPPLPAQLRRWETMKDKTVQGSTWHAPILLPHRSLDLDPFAVGMQTSIIYAADRRIGLFRPETVEKLKLECTRWTEIWCFCMG